MARLTKAQILNLTPKEIEHMRRYDIKQLKQITSDLQAINRKSYIRLKGKGIESPYVKSYERSGGPMSLKGLGVGKNKSTEQIMKEATAIKNELEAQLSHLKAQTRTMKGSQKVYSEMRQKIDPAGQVLAANIEDMDKDEVSKYWEVYHKWSEDHVVDSQQGSPPVAVSSIIWKNMDANKTADEILKQVDEDYKELYIQKEKKANEDYSPNPYSIPGENQY